MTNKIDELREAIAKIELELNKTKALFQELGVSAEDSSAMDAKARDLGSETINGQDKIVEGVFDGQQMIGPDGKRYSIPANYCSKSKLVEGDILKLIIKPDGSFVYKQIGPIERKRIKGILVKEPIGGDFKIKVEGQEYKVLKASVTYFKGQENDQVIALVPQDGEAIWAAVENIIRMHAQLDQDEEVEANFTEDNNLTEDSDSINNLSNLDI